MKVSQVKNIIREKLNLKETNNQVNDYYNQIINQIKTISKKLSDDDSFELHEKLKSFFNRLLENNENQTEIPKNILDWLYNKFDKAEVDRLKQNITPEEITGLNHAYKKAKEGDTGFATNYIKNMLK